MKVWTRQPNGKYRREGEVSTRLVRLEILRPGKRNPETIYSRARAEQIIEEAIASGHARADAYRLHPVEPVPDPAKAERLEALRARQRSTRWREPAKTRTEAARRAWETRRARKEQMQ